MSNNKLIFKPRGLPPASAEQLSIVNAIKDGNNVLVDSVFGSGKTTNILHVSKMVPNFNIHCITYRKN